MLGPPDSGSHWPISPVPLPQAQSHSGCPLPTAHTSGYSDNPHMVAAACPWPMSMKAGQSDPSVAGEGQALHPSLSTLGLTRSTTGAGSKAAKKGAVWDRERTFDWADPERWSGWVTRPMPLTCTQSYGKQLLWSPTSNLLTLPAAGQGWASRNLLSISTSK